MHDWTQPTVSTKKMGDQFYRVWINGEEVGTVKKTIVHGKTQMWKHSWSRQYFDTKKEAVEGLVNIITS